MANIGMAQVVLQEQAHSHVQLLAQRYVKMMYLQEMGHMTYTMEVHHSVPVEAFLSIINSELKQLK